MHKLEELKGMLFKELEEYVIRGELSANSLDIINKLTHSIKSIETIMAMEGSYVKKEASPKDELRNELNNLLKDAKDEDSRRMISEWVKEIS